MIIYSIAARQILPCDKEAMLRWSQIDLEFDKMMDRGLEMARRPWRSIADLMRAVVNEKYDKLRVEQGVES